MTDKPALVDSNILVYAYDKAYPEENKKCSDLVRQAFEGTTVLAVSIQNISEFYVIVTSKIEKPIDHDKASMVIDSILNIRSWLVLEPNKESIAEALSIVKQYKCHYWDALIAAVMKQNGIRRIYTENTKDFGKIPWIEAINPLT